MMSQLLIVVRRANVGAEGSRGREGSRVENAIGGKGDGGGSGIDEVDEVDSENLDIWEGFSGLDVRCCGRKWGEGE